MTAFSSPAPSAWWASSAGSASPSASSAARRCACSSALRCGAMPASTAIRTSSCRNRRPPPSGDKDPGRQALADRRVGAKSRRHEPLVHPRPGHGRGSPPRAACRRRRASRAPTASRTVGGHRRPSGLQDLAHVERVAAGYAVQLDGINVTLPDECPDSLLGQWRQPHPPGRALRGEIAEDHTERMVGGQLVVAVCGDHECGTFGPAADRGNFNRSTVASSAQCTSSITAMVQAPGEPISARKAANSRSRGAPRRHSSAKFPAGLRADVEQRPERPRGQQAIAAAPQPAGARRAAARTPRAARSSRSQTHRTPGPAGRCRFSLLRSVLGQTSAETTPAPTAPSYEPPDCSPGW